MVLTLFQKPCSMRGQIEAASTEFETDALRSNAGVVRRGCNAVSNAPHELTSADAPLLSPCSGSKETATP